jgi:predicted alpha-1,2-mannosidase
MLPLLACVPEIGVPPTEAPIEAVDPFIATGGPGYRVGSSTPAATVPFGMVKLGPDTSNGGVEVGPYHCSGYYWDDTDIIGFSHLHMHGVGVPDMGTILVTPLTSWSGQTDTDAYLHAFSHDNETAWPGGYHVELDDGIVVDLAASAHAGVHRYAFPGEAEPTLVVDLEHVLGGRSAGGEVAVDAASGVVEGYMLNAGSFSGGSPLPVYFHAVVEGGFGSFGTWGDDEPVEGRTGASGIDLGVWLSVSPTTEVRVGLSTTSVADAAANLAAEVGDASLEEIQAAASGAWEGELAKFELEGADETERAIFWTAVYHLLQMPTRYDNADGSYLGFDRVVHPDPGWVWSSDFSLWDTYRTAQPAFNLFYPEVAGDMAQSLVDMAQKGGSFPRWPVAGGDGSSMIGQPAHIALADAWVKGVTDWDVEAAWPLLDAQARGIGDYPYNGRPEVATQDALGYLPEDLVGGSVAWVQELAWADAATAQLAVALGHPADAAYYMNRAGDWRNQYDPDRGFFHARYADGSFEVSFDEDLFQDEYTEGNAWHYLWPGPWDAAGLAETLGGEAVAKERLESFMQGGADAGMSEWPYLRYWHGNEPDIHAPWLFSLWGDRDATAGWVGWVMDERYFAEADGLAGNDDAGTLSAWYIFGALGFYPIAGTTSYILGAPRFDRVRFRVGDGWFEVRRKGSGGHVARTTLNGLPWTRATFTHDQLVAGGSLVVEME